MLQFDEYKVKLNNLKPELERLGQSLDLESAERELDMLHAESASEGFWNNVEKAQKVQQRISQLEGKVNAQAKRLSSWEDLMVLCEMGNEEEDASLVPEVEQGYEALVQMLDDCTAAGIEYDFNSAYRTVEEQAQILAQRTQEYMDYYEWEEEKAREKALETVALPGTSEHNLGLAVDLLGSQAVAWFQEHCWDYGFIVRYAADKQDYTGITNEPWHFRYVGKEVALELKDSGLCLEEYLGAPPAG